MIIGRNISVALLLIALFSIKFPVSADDVFPGFEKIKGQREIPFSKLFTQMFTENEVIQYDNVRFINDLGTLFKPDDPVDVRRFLTKRLHLKDSGGYYLTRYDDFILKDCIFDDNIIFTKIIFSDARWSAENCSMLGRDAEGVWEDWFRFDSCRLESQFDVSKGGGKHPQKYALNKCFVGNIWIDISSRTQITFTQCEIGFVVNLTGNDESRINFIRTSFGTNKRIEATYIEAKENSSLTFDSCIFKAPANYPITIQCDLGVLTLTHNRFGGKVFISSKERTELFLESNRFEQLESPLLNEVSRLSRISSNGASDFYFYPFDSACIARGFLPDSLLKEPTIFGKAISSCKNFYDHFKGIGNTEMANHVFAHIQDIEHMRQQYLYDRDPSFRLFFSIQLGKLLKFYTNYGTDPARALVISFYIIFLFGIFYFFFPSDWDIASKTTLIQNFRIFVDKNEQGYLRPFFVLMFGLMVSLINAATLSLNSFTTLGFGDIPTTGLARYVCVIQGFIGWFLLSLFTVALINQAQF